MDRFTVRHGETQQTSATIKRTIFALLMLACLSACSQAPDCRVIPEHAEQARGNAGCLVKQADHLLVVEHRNGRLGFPAGLSEGGETAQCTAHRETWEETGLAVEVGHLLHVFDNGFRLYSCRLVDPGVTPAQEIPPPWLARREIHDVQWRQPPSIEAMQWRYPQQWPLVQKILSELP